MMKSPCIRQRFYQERKYVTIFWIINVINSHENKGKKNLLKKEFLSQQKMELFPRIETLEISHWILWTIQYRKTQMHQENCKINEDGEDFFHGNGIQTQSSSQFSHGFASLWKHFHTLPAKSFHIMKRFSCITCFVICNL